MQIDFRFLVVVGLVSINFILGCGGNNNTAMPKESEEQLALQDLARMLDDLSKAGEKPPANTSDLEKFSMIYPYASPLLRSKRVEYFFGANIDKSDTSPKLVAKQTDAEKEGGWVLLSNSEIKKMTADEVKALPRAGKAGKK